MSTLNPVKVVADWVRYFFFWFKFIIELSLVFTFIWFSRSSKLFLRHLGTKFWPHASQSLSRWSRHSHRQYIYIFSMLQDINSFFVFAFWSVYWIFFIAVCDVLCLCSWSCKLWWGICHEPCRNFCLRCQPHMPQVICLHLMVYSQ